MMRASRSTWLLGACALLSAALCACATPRPVPPARAQVRLDLAARALARARDSSAQACSPLRGCDRAEPRFAMLDRAISDAELWLDATQAAADDWSAGDGRQYALVRPCLGVQLDAVADALTSAGLAEPPGLRSLEPAVSCELEHPP